MRVTNNSHKSNIQNSVRQILHQNKNIDNNNFNNKNSKMSGEGIDVGVTEAADEYFRNNNNNIGKKNNKDDLTAFVKLKKLLGIQLTPWENYMNGVNSYQQNIQQHFQNMINGLGKLGSSNNGLLPLMMMGGNFGNILKKQKLNNEYINLKIKNNIPLSAQEKH
jgi:hypothetical protein